MFQGHVECWDPRSRSRVGVLDVGMSGLDFQRYRKLEMHLRVHCISVCLHDSHSGIKRVKRVILLACIVLSKECLLQSSQFVLLHWQIFPSLISWRSIRSWYSEFQVTVMIQGCFGGLKFSIPGVLGVEKFGTYFLGWLDLSRELIFGPGIF